MFKHPSLCKHTEFCCCKLPSVIPIQRVGNAKSSNIAFSSLITAHDVIVFARAFAHGRAVNSCCGIGSLALAIAVCQTNFTFGYIFLQLRCHAGPKESLPCSSHTALNSDVRRVGLFHQFFHESSRNNQLLAFED